MINDALDSLVTAVRTERADVIQNVVKTVKKCEENDEGIGLTLNNLFRSECCEFGTILHLAVHERSKDSVRTLLTLGAYPSCKNEAGVTALESATDAEIVAVFNEQLLHCIAQKDLARVEEYLDAGCDVNCVDSSRTRNTPLHWAASYGSPEILQVLIEDGGNTNAQNADGITPLHDAVQRKDQSIIKMLLDCNADVSLAAHSGKLAGKSPLDIADDTVYSMLTYQSPSDSVKPEFSDIGSVNNSAVLSPNGISSLLNFSKNVAPQRHADELSALVTKLEEQSAATSHVYDEIGVESSNGTASGEGDTTVADGCVPDLSPIEQQLKLLWPTPQKLTIHPERGEFRAKDRIVIAAVSGPEPGIVHEMLNVWRAKRQSFLDLNIEFLMETIAYQTTPAIISFDIPSIVCQVDQNLFKTSSSYKLTILKNQIRVVASDLGGLHYAASTLIQLLEIFDADEAVPCLQIHDWPDVRFRGVMLDCSKGRIMHEANLWELVDRLSILKLNEVHLYTKIDVPKLSSGNQDIWQFPYTRSMLIEFDRFCEQRFVTLVPVLDISYNVDYEKFTNLFPLFLDYLTCFTTSRKVTIGPRLSLMLLDVGDRGMLSTRNFLPLSDNHQLLLCGEALKQAGNIQQCLMWLPSNMVLMSYGYTATHNFTPVIQEYADYGVAYYLCPGTSSWNSLAGCPESALENIQNALKQGVDNQALGMVICDWSGRGHVTDSLFSLPPLVAMAGMCWNKRVDTTMLMSYLPNLINVHMLSDETRQVGQVILELGKLEADLIRVSKQLSGDDKCSLDVDKGSILFQLLTSPDNLDLTNFTPTHFQKALRTIRRLHGIVQSVRLHCYQDSEQIRAVRLTLDLTLTAARIGLALTTAGKNPDPAGSIKTINIGIDNLPVTAKTDLANRLLALQDTHKSCWMSRYLLNGYQESQATTFGLINLLLPSAERERHAN